MAEPNDDPLSPTVIKVLDQYLDALLADETIDNDVTKQLGALLLKGKVPKPEDIDAALSLPPKVGEP